MLTIGDKLPDFKVRATVSTEKGKEFKDLSNKDVKGKWLVLFAWPKDFTFICPTEIAEFNRRNRDFKERDAVVYGLSTDNEYSHLAWRKDHADLRNLEIPMLAGVTLARDLGIMHKDEGVALRATFIADPDGVIRYVSVNDLNVGRNVEEVVRTLDALQTGELCQCGWQPGEQTLTAAMAS